MVTTKNLDNLSELDHFTTSEIRTYLEMSDNSLKKYISRSISRGEIIPIKRGTYTTSKYLSRLKDNERESYYEYISTLLRAPSYLSSAYVLSRFDMLSEGVKAYTLITLKNTANYSNNFGEYRYKSIKESLFDGYKTSSFRDKTYYTATLGKALFDYLYFQKTSISGLAKRDIAEELRLRLGPISTEDWEIFNSFVEKSGSVSMKKISSNLYKNAHNNN